MARKQLRKIKKKPLIVICSEGAKKSSEYYYFRNFANRNLRIQFSTGNSTDPKGMLDDLLKYIKNEDIESEEQCKIFLVLDTDLKDSRINEIKKVEKLCLDNDIEMIISSPSFEVWYLMHFRKNNLKFKNSQSVKSEIRKINGTYSETMNMYDIIKSNTLVAFEIAKSLEVKYIKNSEDVFVSNPYTSVYRIIEMIDNFNK